MQQQQQQSSHNAARQNHFANSAGAAYRTNLFATDYFHQQQQLQPQEPQHQQQQQKTTRGSTNSDTRNNGMNTMGSNAINFTAYQQPNYPQYAHTAPRNRSSATTTNASAGTATLGPSPRHANVLGAHKVINDQSGDKINSGGSFMDQCNSKSLVPNPFLISRAAAGSGATAAGQSKGKLAVSASMTATVTGGPNEGGGGTDRTNKKFNSLKSSLAGLRKTPQFYYSMRNNGGNGGKSGGQSKAGKSCKRHQSFNQAKADGDVRYEEEEDDVQQQQQPQGDYYYEGGEQQHSLYYEEQPLYENLTDSIQIHELSASSVQQQQQQSLNPNQVDQQALVINDQKGQAQQQQQQKPKHQQKPLNKIHQHRHHHHHHHHQQQQEKLKKAHHKSCDMIERNSIYRSDSGISNSSYECITPVPAPRTGPNGELLVGAGGLPAGYSECGGVSSRKSKKKMPVYMNLACHLGQTREAVGGAGAAAGTDCVDGMSRAAVAVNSITNTNPAEVCVPNFNSIINIYY